MAHGPDRQSRPQLDQDTLFTQWQEGLLLGAAWLVYADERDSTRFLELRRIDSHLELQSFLQGDLIGRLRDGKLQALGIQEGSDAGPIQIPQYYFSKTAQVDERRISSLLSAKHSMRSELSGRENRQTQHGRSSQRGGFISVSSNPYRS
jgi:hypothetical protein